MASSSSFNYPDTNGSTNPVRTSSISTRPTEGYRAPNASSTAVSDSAEQPPSSARVHHRRLAIVGTEPKPPRNQADAHYLFSNDVDRVGEYVKVLLSGRNLRESVTRELEMSLKELLLNAVEHGNLEVSSEPEADGPPRCAWRMLVSSRCRSLPYRARTVRVSSRWSEEHVSFTIADMGKGFDWRPFIGSDSTVCTSGLAVARKAVDTLSFNSAGNEVSIVKKL